jgi:hypothetical protein
MRYFSPVITIGSPVSPVSAAAVAAAVAGIVDAPDASASADAGVAARSLAWAPVPNRSEDPTIRDAVFLHERIPALEENRDTNDPCFGMQ